MKTNLIGQGGAAGASLYAALKGLTENQAFDRVDVAVAYATLQGVKTLTQALGGLPPVSRWVVGLDDAITQPEAIEHLMKLAGAQVRLASLAPKRRFHPKIYRLWSSTHPQLCVLALGSGNMTQNGLRFNGEAAALLTSESAAEAKELENAWLEMWGLGVDATDAAIAIYRSKYAEAKKERKKIAALGVAPPEPEPDAVVEDNVIFNGEPATASVAWTEGATPSAGGRDLELPRLIMPFFTLGRSPVVKRFRVVNGGVFSLTFTMRTDNQMWRLMFSRDAIAAAIGRDSLRPAMGNSTRSDLAIVFTRISGAADFDLHMVAIGSAQHQQLMQRTSAGGRLHRTRDPGGRNFGFY